MKILKLSMLALLVAGMTSCHMNENIQVKSNGSGQMAMNIDMSQAIDMMQALMSKDDLAKKETVKMDTTFLMKDLIPDTSTALPADTKTVMRMASMHLHMDMDAKILKIDMLFPFNNLNELQTLYNNMNNGSMGTAQLFKGLLPGQGQSGSMGGGSGADNPDFSQFIGIYEYTIRDGLMSRKLNEDKWKNLQSNPMFAQAKSVTTMGADITYTTSITLPRPIKKVDNPVATLSDDKRTVTMAYKLTDVLDHPEGFAYNIEY